MQLGPIAEDVIERNWILVGFLAWLLLIPLAVTSTTGWIRRMGGKRWNRLHKLIYPIGGFGGTALPMANQITRNRTARLRLDPARSIWPALVGAKVESGYR